MSRVIDYMTQPQVLELLGNIDYKTLKNWSRLVSPAIQGEKREGFGNTVWYRKTDVRRLVRFAEEHHHLPRQSEEEEEHETDRDIISISVSPREQIVALLSYPEARQVLEEIVRDEVQRRVRQERLEIEAEAQQVIDQIKREIERLQSEVRNASLISSLPPSPVSTETREGAPPPNNALQGTGTEVSDVLTSGVKRYVRPSNRASLETAGGHDQHTWTEAELFEENWIDEVEGRLVSRARMAKAHAIPDTNLRRDIESRGVLSMVNKKWLHKGAWKTGGFTAAQRRRVWRNITTCHGSILARFV